MKLLDLAALTFIMALLQVDHVSNLIKLDKVNIHYNGKVFCFRKNDII
jgi:hypothetical protein